ncbi:unnamed protein product, partial [Iphiclides podalirius]
MDMRDRHEALLPTEAAVDIKGKLDKDTALYLWDSFGHILPEVLYEVASEQPKNPIHCLAHKLLRYKYDRTLQEMQQKRDEASSYRAGIYQDRKDTSGVFMDDSYEISSNYNSGKKKASFNYDAVLSSTIPITQSFQSRNCKD